MTPEFVVMIGAFPPPVGGAAKNNQLLHDSLVKAGVAVSKFDTAAKGHQLHHRSLKFHAERIRLNVSALFGTRHRAGARGALYIVPDGGLGVLYTLAQVKLASHRFGAVILHHRTFRYIDGHSAAMAAIVATCPERMTHVFLSQGMKERFERRYGPVMHRIASNARFVESEAQEEPLPRQPGRLRVGHLSNLCREKGFFDVVDAFADICGLGIDAELVLAGPVIEPEVAARLAALLVEYPDAVTHLGAVAGTAKRDFYRNLDLFMFPTRFDQEAAPNVVYEALAAGVPVIATQRGCIAEMLADFPASECVANDAFGPVAAALAASLPADRNRVRAAAIKSLMREQCTLSRQQYAELMTSLGAGPDALVGQEF